MPEQTIASVNTQYMNLSALTGDALYIWLDECRSSGAECALWAVDSKDSSSTNAAWLAPATTDNFRFAVCERGKLAIHVFIVVNAMQYSRMSLIRPLRDRAHFGKLNMSDN